MRTRLKWQSYRWLVQPLYEIIRRSVVGSCRHNNIICQKFLIFLYLHWFRSLVKWILVTIPWDISQKIMYHMIQLIIIDSVGIILCRAMYKNAQKGHWSKKKMIVFWFCLQYDIVWRYFPHNNLHKIRNWLNITISSDF